MMQAEPELAPPEYKPETGVLLEHADLRRPEAWSTGLRLPWCFAGASVLLASFAVAPGVEGVLGGALGLCMLGIAATDARRFVVPDALSGGALALGLIRSVMTDPDSGAEGLLIALSRAALTAGLLLLIRVAYRRFRGRDGLGLGDVKLAAAAGAWLSMPVLPVAIEFAAVTALIAYVFRQRRRMRVLRGASRVPFGAFFALAIWLGWALDMMLAYRS
jgi:leader peptidase (prepilin peptidase) / N-methyltransferase